MRNIEMIKKTMLCLCVMGMALGVHAAERAKDQPIRQAQDRPNVLFIFADDMTYETIGAYKMLDIDTPNLDTLVERGATFTHAYNMGAWKGAVCVASRAMLNTGRFVWQAQNLDSKTQMKKWAKKGNFWSQRMEALGYQTYMTGKWHVTISPETVFDVTKDVRGGMPKQTPAGYNRPKSPEDYATGWKPWETKYGGFWKGGTHWSEVVANDGVEFLQQAAQSDKPFFMYLAFNAGHDPRQSPKEYIDRYPLSRIQMPENFLPEYPYAEAICGKQLRDEKLMPYPRTEYAVKVNRQEYFALITHMDDQIGRIFHALEETGQADNTYIIFTADHGLSVGHHGLVGKQNMYDHSVRVPFMIVGPKVKAGMKIDAPIYLQDAMATSLELAGDAHPEGIDFASLMPLLRGETTEHYDEIYGAYMNSQRMITKNGWKLMVYPTAGVERLYNLEADPQEMNDLAGNPEYGPKMKELRAALGTLSETLGDPMLGGDPSVRAHEMKSVPAVTVEPDEDGAILLRAVEAKIHGAGKSPARYMSDRQSIGYWKSPESFVEWAFVAKTPGTYTVMAEVGSKKEASITVSLAGNSQVVKLAPSGSLKKYKWMKAGKITLPKAGEYTIFFKPVSKDWNAINLRAVVLQPDARSE
jgi:arylsulfatase A-like enzyme